MKKVIFFFILSPLLLLSSCDKEMTVIVRERFEDEYGVHYNTKTSRDHDWTKSTIYDFETYRAGYEYVIKVKKVTTKNPLPDSGSWWYVYQETISKTRVDS